MHRAGAAHEECGWKQGKTTDIRRASATTVALTQTGLLYGSTLQRELLDRRSWSTRKEPASAIFEWIEAWYNPRRRHTSIGHLSPVDYERLYTAAAAAA